MSTQQLPELSEAALDAVREDVVAKLQEMEVYQDDVLPQYILVMVKNRKSGKDIAEQLTMFLLDDTQTFVDWLVERINSGRQIVEPEATKSDVIVDDIQDNVTNKRKAEDDDEVPLDKRARVEGQKQQDNAEETNENAEVPEENPTGRPICSFYPNCRNGDTCPFFHPSASLVGGSVAVKSRSPKPCANFPYCSWGDECNFHHPLPSCRFGPNCRNMSCAFNHPDGMTQSYGQAAFGSYGGFAAMGYGNYGGAQSPVKCRFFPNCANPNCQFFHPVACKFGDNCTKVNCQFIHSGK
eukprot:Ihof_evm2s766 gene=Ihof_evmTU2s766